jgi:hypothetical protein
MVLVAAAASHRDRWHLQVIAAAETGPAVQPANNNLLTLLMPEAAAALQQPARLAGQADWGNANNGNLKAVAAARTARLTTAAPGEQPGLATSPRDVDQLVKGRWPLSTSCPSGAHLWRGNCTLAKKLSNTPHFWPDIRSAGRNVQKALRAFCTLRGTTSQGLGHGPKNIKPSMSLGALHPTVQQVTGACCHSFSEGGRHRCSSQDQGQQPGSVAETSSSTALQVTYTHDCAGSSLLRLKRKPDAAAVDGAGPARCVTRVQ